MVNLGYLASLEYYSPKECLCQAEMVDSAGFESLWINDHFHPWFDELHDGTSAHGGNCWTWLAAALERTEQLNLGTGVTAMVKRHHPADIAHRIATLMALHPGRLLLGVGTGHAVNESPLGYEWPDYSERAKRTAEGIRLVRKMFEQEYVSFEGKYWNVDTAKLFTGPNVPPSIHIAATGSTSIRMAGDLGDGVITPPRSSDELNNEFFPALREGVKKSNYNDSIDEIEKTVVINCSFDENKDDAIEACKPWRILLLPMIYDYDIYDPRYLQAHAEKVDLDLLEENFLITSDPRKFNETIQEYQDFGFDRVLLMSVSPNQGRFCEMIRDDVLPQFT